MRKLIVIFLSLLFAVPAMSDGVHLDTDDVVSTMQQYIEEDKVAPALSEYLSGVRDAGGNGIEPGRLWGVCSVAGMNVKESAGKQKCETFVNTLVGAGVKYFEVCGDEKGKSGGNEYCIDNVFANKFIGGTKVNLSAAVALAQEYARVQKGDDSLQCSKETTKRWGGMDDGVKCTSKKKKDYYEFVFDSVTASIDNTIKNDIAVAVCKIHDTTGSGAGCYGGGEAGGMRECYNAYCNADSTKCNAINTSLKKFGYTAKHDGKICQIDFGTVNDASKLRNDFKDKGIDNFVFCSQDIQVSNDSSVNDALREYLATHANVSKSSVECIAGFKTYTGPGCRSVWYNVKDDIITCSVGDKAIDFVIDDVNEKIRYVQRGGMSGLQCINSDGVFDGAKCSALNESQCNALKQKMQATYPDAAEIRWNGSVCVLPDAKAAQLTTSITEYTAKTGLALVVVVSAAASGGSTLFIAGTVTAAAGLVATSVADGVMKFGKFQPWVDKINDCLASGDAACAETIVRRDVQEMQSYAKEFTPQQQAALDEIFDRLIDKIPDDSDFWDDFFGNPEFFDCDKSGLNCAVKTKTQAWQYVRTAGSGLQIAGGLMQLIGNIGNMMKSIESIKAKVINNMNNKVPLLKHYNPNGTTGAIVANSVTKAWYGTGNSQLVKNMGWKVGEIVTLSNRQTVFVQFAKPNGMAIVEILRATGVEGHDLAKSSPPYIVSRNRNNNDNNTPDTDTPKNDLTGGDDASNDKKTPVAVVPVPVIPAADTNTSVVPVPVPPVVNTNTPVLPQVANTPAANTVSIEIPVATAVAPTNHDNSRRANASHIADNKIGGTTPSKAKGRQNTGAIVAAAVGGTVATGLLVGGIVVATSGKKSSSGGAVTNIPQTDTALEDLMNRASGVLGIVGNRNLTLIPLPTTVNSNAPIVMIDGRVVVVVGYNGYKLPFYLSGGTWAPLLGIGDVGRWFNVYPNGTSSGIAKIDKITSILNQRLTPSLVNRYTATNNMYGVTFPTAAQTAFGIINAEFPSGVVQTQNFTDTDRQLYNYNYQLMQSKME